MNLFKISKGALVMKFIEHRYSSVTFVDLWRYFFTHFIYITELYLDSDI